MSALTELDRSLMALRLEVPKSVADHHEALVRAALEAAEKERDALWEALDWIECEPEDPLKVQSRALASLAAVGARQEPPPTDAQSDIEPSDVRARGEA